MTRPPRAAHRRRLSRRRHRSVPAAARHRAGSARCARHRPASVRLRGIARPQGHRMRAGSVHGQRRAPGAGAEHADFHAAAPARQLVGFTARWSARRWAAGLGLLLLVHRLEVDFGKHAPAGSRRAWRCRRRWRAGRGRRSAGKRCRGLPHLRRPECCGSRRCRLLGLDQEHRLVVDLGRAPWPVTVTSNMPSPTVSAPMPSLDVDLRRCPARAGPAASWAARATDPSGRSRWIWKTGVLGLWSAMADFRWEGSAANRRGKCGAAASWTGRRRVGAGGGDYGVRRPEAAASGRRARRARSGRRSRRRECRR